MGADHQQGVKSYSESSSAVGLHGYNAQMQNWVSVALIFIAGIGSGILIATIWTRLSAAKKRDDVTTARRRILAGVRETHDEEILHEAFRATDDLRSELFKSLHRLRASMNVMFGPVPEPWDEREKSASRGSEPTGTESGRS